jgi:hypothetical protein
MELKQERYKASDDAKSVEREKQSAPRKRKVDATLQLQTAVHSKRNPVSFLDDDLVPEFGIPNSSKLQADPPVAFKVLKCQGSCPLVQGIFYLATALRSEELDRPRILVAIQGIANAIDRLSSKGSPISTHGKQPNSSRPLEEVCMVFARTYSLLLRSVQAVFDETDRTQPSLGVTEVVRSFQTFLGQLHQSSLDELVRQESKAKTRKKTIRTKTREGVHDNDNGNIASAHYRRSKCLVRVLVSMITTLDVTQPSHCDVLEGLMCALLDHVGSSLSLLVFADPNMSPKDPGGICPPQGLLHVAHLEYKDAIAVAKLEGPWLVQILREAVAFLYASAPNMFGDSLTQFVPLNWRQLKGANLHEGLRQSLQHTLLRGVFGDDDETFYSALGRMEGDGDDDDDDDNVESARLKNEQQDPADSFIAQLWEILGWSILSGARST